MGILPQQLFLENLIGKNHYNPRVLKPIPLSELLSPVFTGYED